jgi:hypothetical protein
MDQTPVADGDFVGGQADGDFVGGQADLLQVARVTVGEEDVRSPQELVQLGAIVTGIEEGLTVGAERGAGELAVVEVVAGEGVGDALGGDAENVLDALAVLGRDDAAVS